MLDFIPKIPLPAVWIETAPQFLPLALIPYILLSRKKPVATLAWIWFVLLFPYTGCFAYLILGRIPRGHRASGTLKPFPGGGAERDGRIGETPRLPALLKRLTGSPPSTATRFSLHEDAHSFYRQLSTLLANARSEILFQSFVWRPDSVGQNFVNLLAGAARRGVQVRLLLDPIGSLELKDSSLAPLIMAGGRFAWFRPPSLLTQLCQLNLRNHRKLQIIDGSVAFVGGMNIGAEHLSSTPGEIVWRDLQAEVEGPIVALLRKRFVWDWYFATREKIVRDPEEAAPLGKGLPCQILEGHPGSSPHGMHAPLIALLNQAKHRVWIATGYFAPSEPLLCALQICAARGVDVRLLISEKSDHPYLVIAGRSYYEELLHVGIRVYEYSKAIHHTKAMLIDHSWILIGSANCDHRSLYLNFELGLLHRCRKTARQLESIFRTDFSGSREIQPAEFFRRPFSARALEALLRPLTPFF